MTAAPSFDSFPDVVPSRPRPAAQTQSTADHHQRDHRSRREPERHVKREKHTKRKRDESDETVRSSTEAERVPVRRKPTAATPIISDPAGETASSIYGNELYAGDVPRFYRLGQGRVLGCHPSLRIALAQKGSRRALVVLPRNQHALARYTDKAYSWRLYDKQLKLVQLRPTRTESGDPGVFVSLLKEDVSKPSLATGTALDQHVDDSDTDDQDVLSYDVEQEDAKSYLDHATAKNARLSKQCADHPLNIQAWLDFVDFQDEFLSSNPTVTTNMNERRATAEAKLAILDKALLHNPGSPDLIRRRLSTGAVIWSSDELDREWRKAVYRSASTFPRLHLDWLVWKATDASQLKCRSSLIKMAAEAMQQLTHVDDKIDVFLFTIHTLRSAGYSERAYAAFQALMELNFFAPASASGTSLDALLDQLEIFWDAEVPRFGEAGAKGWAHTDLDAAPPIQPTSTLSHSDTAEDNDMDGFARWALAERRAAAASVFPARLSDEDEDESDVYSVVLFADIRPLLFLIEPGFNRQDQQERLVFAYLDFFGLSLPLPFQTSTDMDTLFSTVDIQAVLPDASTLSRPKDPFQVIAGEPMEPARQVLASLRPIARLWPLDVALLFDDPEWISQLDTRHTHVQHVKHALDLLVAHNTLPSSHLRSAYIAMEAALTPPTSKAASKLSKKLLATSPQDMSLGNTYALLEYHRNHKQVAERVWRTCLASAPLAPVEIQAVVWHTWAKKLFLDFMRGGADAADNRQMAINVLVAQTVAQRKQLLEQLSPRQPLDDLIPEAKEWYEQESHVKMPLLCDCHALLCYLSEIKSESDRGRGLDIACTIYDTALLKTEKGSREQEQVIMYHAELLYRHSKSVALYKPGTLRNVLERGFAIFPKNFLLLQLYLVNESRTRIQNRVRNMLESILKRPDCKQDAALWLFRIYAEIHMDPSGFNHDSVVLLFERAVLDVKPAHRAYVWKTFVQFVVGTGRQGDQHDMKHGELVKNVVVRALQQCPAHKDIYLAAFEPHTRQFWRRSELDHVYAAMEEHELRVMVKAEPFLAIEDLDFMSEDEQDDQEEDYARDLKERRRLMPY